MPEPASISTMVFVVDPDRLGFDKDFAFAVICILTSAAEAEHS
jgi:hypothetical protein